MAIQVPGPARGPVLSLVSGRDAHVPVVPALAIALKTVVVMAMLRPVADPA